MDATSRRLFLSALGIGTGVSAVAACSRDGSTSDTGSSATPGQADDPVDVAAPEVPSDPGFASDPFTVGVASGDPLPDAVMLWTRLAPQPEADDGGIAAADEDIEVAWELAADADFATLAAAGIATAEAAAAHTVRVDAGGLLPATWYHYRFRVGDWVSPPARTRTAPASGADPTGSGDTLEFGFASCQSFQNGWYNAWRDITEADLDLVVFLGDYIYENAGRAVDPADEVIRPLGSDPDESECTTLADYRRRYAIYRGDESLRAAHAAAPWLVIWDDHEVDNNYAGTVGEKEEDADAPSAYRAEFEERRNAAYRAWWENMPVRLPPPDGSEFRVDRRIDWGTLASFFLIDSRQYRDDQACGGATFDLSAACDEVGDPGRTLLGTAQEERLIAGLTESTATWNVIGNQTVMSPLVVGDAVLNYDQWDGYPAARDRLLQAIDSAGLTNTVVITGDIHVAGVGDIQLGEGEETRTVATELVGTSISSLAPIPEDLSALVPSLLPWVQYFDARRGWTRCSVSAGQWEAEYRVIEDNLVQDAPVTADATFVIKPDRPGAVPA